MANELAAFTNSAPLATQDLNTALQSAIVDAQSNSGLAYLKVRQTDGALVFGADAEEVDPDSRWAIDVSNLQHGWMLRDQAEVLGSDFVPLYEHPKVRPEGARAAYRGVMRCVSPEHQGVQVEFGGDSLYITKFWTQQIFPAIQKRLATDSTVIYPIVTLDVQNYTAKKSRKKIFTLNATVVAWVDKNLDGVPPPVEETPEPPAATKTKRRVRVLNDDDLPA